MTHSHPTHSNDLNPSLDDLFKSLALALPEGKGNNAGQCDENQNGLPEVDCRAIEAYADRVLPEQAQQLVAGLIARSDAWRDAYKAALVKRTKDPGQSKE